MMKNYILIAWAVIWIVLVKISVKLYNITPYAMLVGLAGTVLFSGEPFQAIPLAISGGLMLFGFANLYVVDLAYKLKWIDKHLMLF